MPQADDASAQVLPEASELAQAATGSGGGGKDGNGGGVGEEPGGRAWTGGLTVSVYSVPRQSIDLKYEFVEPRSSRTPDDVIAFLDQVSRMEVVIREIAWPRTGWHRRRDVSGTMDDKTWNRIEYYFEKLRRVASLGLEGQRREAGLAVLGLRMVREELESEFAPEILGSYLVSLATWAGVAMAVVSLVAALLGSYQEWLYLLVGPGIDAARGAARLQMLLHALSGAAAGAWLSFALRRDTCGLAALRQITCEPLPGLLRIGFVLMAAGVVLLLLVCGVVVVDVGVFDTRQITSSLSVALTVGVLLGLSEQALPNVLRRQGDQFGGKLAS